MATSYCTQDDLEDRISAVGVTLRDDDTPPDTLGRCIERGSAYVDRYCLAKYTAAELATSVIIQEVTADIATYYLCIRRGNPAPASILDAFTDAIEYLKEVASGAAQIGDAATNRLALPSMSNIAISPRPALHSRVQTRRSVGKRSGRKVRTDYRDPLYYSDYQI